MSVRLKNYSTNGVTQTEWNSDYGWDSNSPVGPDGFQYSFGPNEVKNFMDDNTAINLVANVNGGKVINTVADPIPFGQSQS